MAVIVYDSFTASAGTLLSAHTGETGATWVAADSSTATSPKFDANSRLIGNDNINFAIYLASGSASSAAYDTYFDVLIPSFSGTGDIWSMLVRTNQGDTQRYELLFNAGGAGNVWLRKKDGANFTTMVTTTASAAGLVAGGRYRFKVALTDSGGSTTIACSVADAPGTSFRSLFSSASVNDSSALTAAGKVGFTYSFVDATDGSKGPNFESVQQLTTASTPAVMRGVSVPPVVTPNPSVIVRDSFTATSGTLLSAHTGETGATWAPSASNTATSPKFDANSRLIANDVQNFSMYLPSGAATDPAYDTYFDVLIPSLNGVGDIWSLGFRLNQADTLRYEILFNAGAGGNIQLRKLQGGNLTTLATTTANAAGITVGGRYRFKIVLTDSGGSTVIALSIANAPGTTYRNLFSTASITDNSPITTPGKVGVLYAFINATDGSVGANIESIQQLATGGTPAVMRTVALYNFVPVNDASLSTAFAPNVWYIGQMASGTYEAWTRPVGAEVSFSFTGNYLSIGVDTSYYGSLPAGNYPLLAIDIDDQPRQLIRISQGATRVPVTVPSGTNHTVRVIYATIGATVQFGLNAWTSVNGTDAPNNGLRITGFEVAPTGVISAAPGLPTDLAVVIGDSITEADYSATAAPYNGANAETTYAYRLGECFGYRSIKLSYAGLGLTAPSADGTPTALQALNNYDSNHARDWSTIGLKVKLVYICHGTNDQNSSDGVMQNAVIAILNRCLTIFPNATIVYSIPFGQFKASAIQAGITSVNSPRVKLLNLGSQMSRGLTGAVSYESPDGIHPDTTAHMKARGLVVQGVQALLSGGVVPNPSDTRLGVSVGATTGTLVVPSASNVRSGTSYGAGGTEYTGTLTAGSTGPVPQIGSPFIKAS